MRMLLNIVSILVICCFHLISHAETKSTIEVQGLSFISSDFESVDKSNFWFIGASLVSNEKAPDYFMINLKGFYAPGNTVLNYLNFKEIYFSIDLEPYSKLHIGRKLKNWSSLDSDWNLGFFQPQFRWNPLSPENQGMTGLFWDHDESNWGMTLFASPVFIPDQSAGYEVKNGQFETANPWFNPPPQNIKFQGQVLPIDYKINKPETSDVVLQTLYAAQLRFGEKRGLFANLSAAYKPSNQFAVGYTGVLVTNKVKIDLTPKTYTENDYATDVGYKDSWGLAQISFLASKPHTASFQNVSNTPIIEDSFSWGPKFIYNLKPFQFEVSYFDAQGGNVSETGPDTSADRAALTQVYLFHQAVQLQIKYSEIYLRRMKLESSIQYRQSMKDPFKQIRFSNRFVIKGPWSFNSDILLIDTDDDSNLKMNAYRNLDQFWIGAMYDL
ncbi:MAG: hypothetical protein WA160_15480 [Pseudobdellovibrio sp.]